MVVGLGVILLLSCRGCRGWVGGLGVFIRSNVDGLLWGVIQNICLWGLLGWVVGFPLSVGCPLFLGLSLCSVGWLVGVLCGVSLGVFFGVCSGFVGSCLGCVSMGLYMPFIGLYLPCLVCHPRCCDYAINWAVWLLACVLLCVWLYMAVNGL